MEVAKLLTRPNNWPLTGLKKIFDCDYANVQPHSGAQANAAVCLAVLQPGDKILGLDLSMGGHLTHGSAVNFSGKLYQPHFYGVKKEDGRVDYDSMERVARQEKPKLIICGASAYSRDWDYPRIRQIADQVGALVMCDMAHPAGLIAKQLLNSPFEDCHFVTSTTHKTLRGPRGGIIMMKKDFDNPFGLKDNKGNIRPMSNLLDMAVFPGTPGWSTGTCNRCQSHCFRRNTYRMNLPLCQTDHCECTGHERLLHQKRISILFQEERITI